MVERGTSALSESKHINLQRKCLLLSCHFSVASVLIPIVSNTLEEGSNATLYLMYPLSNTFGKITESAHPQR